jgi:hypothetical protein
MIRPLFVAICLATSFACGDDWSEFLGPQHNNISAEAGLCDRIPAQGLPLVWEREVGTGYSAPSVRGAVLVLHHRLGAEE